MKGFNLKSLPFAVTRREQLAIGIAGGVLAVLLIVQLVVSPIIEKRRRLHRQIEAQAQALQEVQRLKAEFEEIQRMAGQAKSGIAGRQPGFTLFSFLDRLAGQAGLKDRIAYMKPSTNVQEDSPYKLSVVETKLQRITMRQLTTYLYRIETSGNMLRVSRLSISKTGAQSGTVDAVLLVETFET